MASQKVRHKLADILSADEAGQGPARGKDGSMKNLLDTFISRRTFLSLATLTAVSAALNRKELTVLAAADKPKENYPVVVVGGGLGGLTTAAYLARHGFPVTLLEQHNLPGGYATAFDRAGGRFTFDVSLHATSCSATKRFLSEIGAAEAVELVELPELCRVVAKDYTMSWPQGDPEGLIKLVAEKFPSEEKGIRGFISEMTSVAEEAARPFNRSSILAKLLFPFTHRAMWGLRKLTLAQLLDKHVKDSGLRALLSVFWGYYGLPPSELSGFYYAVATGGMIKDRVCYVKSRSQYLSNAIVETIEQQGGRVELETEVSRITVQDGRVSGVVTADGKTYPARAVISNASVPATLNMLPGGAVPEDYRRKIAGYQPSLSSFIVWLGLNRELRGTIDGYEIFLGEDGDPEEGYRACLNCDHHKAGLGVTIYDNAFPGYSAPGTSTVTIIMLSGYMPWKRFEADYFAGRKESYRKEKDRITDILIERAEKSLIPGLRSMIEVKEAATPLTNVRYTRNPAGAIYGFEQSMDNAFMSRLANTTPVKGLYLASAWGNPGGGYTAVMMAGRNTFLALMRDWGFKVRA